jgi:hypothetical protein
VLVIGVSIGVISTKLVIVTTGTLAGTVGVMTVSVGDGGTGRPVSVAVSLIPSLTFAYGAVHLAILRNN